MSKKYFDNFQTINYANTTAVNLLERAVIRNKIINNPYAYYPIDLTQGIRPDQISDSYYEDEFMSWLIYFSNGIIDPYYQWYLSETEFNDFLKKKYGTINNDILKQKVVYFMNNWYSGEQISVSAFNALSVSKQKYWQPVYTTGNSPSAYERQQKDWIINTNEVVSYTVNTANNVFINNEITKVYINSSYVGNGQISFSNTTNVKLQHTIGTVHSNNYTGYLYGTESKSNVSFTASSVVLKNISNDEASYWDRVYIYDMENDKNERNKSIRLLLSNYAPQAAKELRSLLK